MGTNGVESHLSQPSIWNKKTLLQNEYHIYWQNPMINSKNKFKTLVRSLLHLMRVIARTHANTRVTSLMHKK